EPAAQQVVQGGPTEIRPEVLGRNVVDAVEVGTPALAGRLGLHFYAHAAAEPAQRVKETQPLGLHDEVEHVTLGLTAEAVVETAVTIDVERRCLLVVERA